MVTVLAEDDGVGFNTSQKDKQREHWGVLGMKERTSLLGGDFQIQSQVGRGTLVSVTIPYEQAGVEEDHEHSSLVGG
jgi:two-component system sensor histidine kinase DegS